MHPERPADDSAVPPQREAVARPAWWRLPIGAWLIISLAAVLGVFLIGNRLAQQSTQLATQEVRRVQQDLEPLARRTRELGSALAAFDRAVLAYLKSAGDDRRLIEQTDADLGAAVAAHLSAGMTTETVAAARALHERVAEHRRSGLKLVDLYDKRSGILADCWSLLEGLRKRIAGAGASGLFVGDNQLARRSLAELAAAVDAVRASFTAQLAQRSSNAATWNEAAFRRVLARHADEFNHSPGKAWLALVSGDFDRATRLHRGVTQFDAQLGANQHSFASASEALGEDVRSQFEEPAWRALADSVGRAGATVHAAERMIVRVSIAVLIVILLVAAATVYGVTLPVKRLMAGTRRLAAGALDTRVPTGGVRDLDELARGFNHMAGELAIAGQAVRSYQAQLEQRVAQRTRQLRHLAHHDPLTELPNRRRLFAYLNAAIKHAATAQQRIAFLFLDLDNFKAINDSLGHDFGDRVLRLIGERLRGVVGDQGFVARLGGDEFTLILKRAASIEAVDRYAARLVSEFQRPLEVEQRELLIGVSVGAAVYPDHAQDAASLLRAADAALFRAKELGRNRASVYCPELLIAASNRFQTEQALRRAIDQDELMLFYQPQVSLVSNETVIVEALLRWRQSEDLIVPAVEFLGIAEQSGLIMEINDWVMRCAADSVRAWRHSGWPNARVAVNVSAQQFLSGDFVRRVERLLRLHEIPPDCLELELTENVLQTGAVTIATLQNLRRLGVTVALDDFGTGYSSLTSLEQLPVNRVKLDRSLVASVDSNPRSAAIARSIISLCRSLGLQITAEGVERPAQLEFLQMCGDVHIQGYYVARPEPGMSVLDSVAAMPARLAALHQAAERSVPAEYAASENSTILRMRPRRR